MKKSREELKSIILPIVEEYISLFEIEAKDMKHNEHIIARHVRNVFIARNIAKGRKHKLHNLITEIIAEYKINSKSG